MISPVDWESWIKRWQRLNMEMLELAQAGEWETVTEREEQRRVFLDELFESPPPAEFLPLLKDAIQTTLASDVQVQELAHTEIDKLGDNLRTLKQGRRALSAYHDL